MNFQTFLLPKGIWAKKNHKKSTHLDHSYLKYTLVELLTMFLTIFEVKNLVKIYRALSFIRKKLKIYSRSGPSVFLVRKCTLFLRIFLLVWDGRLWNTSFMKRNLESCMKGTLIETNIWQLSFLFWITYVINKIEILFSGPQKFAD